jgi:hypothetical protein
LLVGLVAEITPIRGILGGGKEGIEEIPNLLSAFIGSHLLARAVEGHGQRV